MFKRLVLGITVLLMLSMALGAVQASNTPEVTPDQSLQNTWIQIQTEGETACADGSPYAFWVRQGTSERLTFYFNGGGACWNGTMCALGSGSGGAVSVYTNQLKADETPGAEGVTGMFDLENPENPFKDDTIVGLPYCTGDIFSGSSVVDYETPQGTLEIHHKGYLNTTAVLEWVYENYPSPSSVVLTGCSGGSAGITINGPRIMEHYSDVKTYQLNDSMLGVTVAPPVAFEAWGTYDNWANEIPAVAALSGNFEASAYMQAVADYFPENEFAQFNFAYDVVQTFFYGLLDVPTDAWTSPLPILQLQNSIESLQEAWSEGLHAALERVEADNFHRYVAAGEEHCMLHNESFYNTEADGVRLVEWISDFVSDAPIEDVFCTECAAVAEVAEVE